MTSRDEGGFTLIELIVVTSVIPLIVGALAFGLVSMFSLQSGVSSRLTESGDAQVVSAYFVKDVESAAYLTTNQNSTSTQCGSGTQLLGLEWSFNQTTGAYSTVVSYVEQSNGTATSYSLVRQVCTSGASSTPSSSHTISSDIPNGQLSPSISPSGGNSATAWVSTVGITSVRFDITEPGATTFAYTLVAAPRASTPVSGQSSSVVPSNTNCGFAAPGTGPYASSLCFVDFSNANLSASCGAPSQVTAAVTNTPYTMTFNVCVTGGPVVATSIPTYFNPPYGGAFLGINGFYTGIPGNPALYQIYEGSQGQPTTVVNITNIQVLDARNNPAVGWQLVTGDAESTDAGESMTWNSSVILNQLPYNSIGNACNNPDVQSGKTFTGVGTTTVVCAEPSDAPSSQKTGTVMLESLSPSSVTITMVGAGKEAMFLGLLLQA
jgi:prepilin-type N-terminal cleavage/methylation domain-containing protein